MKKPQTVNKPVVFLWMLHEHAGLSPQGYAQEGTAKRKITGKVTGNWVRKR